MSPRPLEIDLRGKSFDEVMGLLQEHGFSVRAGDGTRIWDDYNAALGKGVKGPRVQIIWILKKEEAPLLTVTIFNGKKITLDESDDLHLFDRPANEAPGQDWAAVHTMHIMR